MKLSANNYLAWLQSSTAGQFNAVKGQGTFTDNRTQNKIDTSDKTTSGYSTGAFGNISIDAELDVRIDLPDANGWSRLETLANSQTPEVFQLRKNGAAGLVGDAVFSALCYFTIKSKSFPKDGVVEAKIGIALAAAPTIDAMA